MHYLKMAFRSLRSRPLFSAINIGGLTVGITCVIIIGLWVRDELSVDRFHAHRSETCRVLMSFGSDYEGIHVPAPLAPAIEKDVPEVSQVTRVGTLPRLVLQHKEKAFYEERGIVADSAFFDIFTFPFVCGDVAAAFASPFNILLTESMSRKYFGNEDPIGKPVTIEGKGVLTVAGVLRDVPRSSHLLFDFVIPFKFLEKVRLAGMEWGDPNFLMYLRLRPGSARGDIGEKITACALRNGSPHVRGGVSRFSVQPLDDVYLHPVNSADIARGSATAVVAFSAIACFILIVACINFVNLSTARAVSRAREMGVRRIVGAQRAQLFAHLLCEFLVVAVLAFVCSVGLVEILVPFVNQLAGTRLTTPGTVFWLMTFPLTLVPMMLLGGVYPALAVSRVGVELLTGGSSRTGHKGTVVRKGLVVFQFAVAVVMIACTIVVFEQMGYIIDRSWSLKNDVIVHIPVKENVGKEFDAVKAELLTDPAIRSVSAKGCLPTVRYNNTTVLWWEGKSQAENGITMETTPVDFDYFRTMELPIVEGRDFSPTSGTDRAAAFILTKEAVRKAGISDPIGKRFRLYDRQGTIIGVVEDSYYQSLKEALRPQVYYLFTNMEREAAFGTVLIRIRPAAGDIAGAIAHVERVWKHFNTFAPFEYQFLDKTIEAQYGSETRLMRLFGTFALLAIVISCLGLFGLATFMVETRAKEVGVRKVLGASSFRINAMLCGDFTKPIAFAAIAGCPIAYFVMSRWLEIFAYRITLSWWIFLVSAATAATIGIVTVSVRAFRASTANPVESLRYE